jgi:mannitol operon transcriptional antiterminator
MLTTRQRDLLQLLLQADAPVGTAEIAAQLKLTPRQVNYSLKSVDSWLNYHRVALKTTPGVGVQLLATPDQQSALVRTLKGDANFDLILTGEQRQQLLAMQLLTAFEPIIMYQLHQMAQVSRTTIQKDLDVVDTWLSTVGCTLERRPNHGIWVEGTEHSLRQALALLLWGSDTWDVPLIRMTHARGLQFSLSADANLLENVKQADNYIRSLKTQRALAQVTQAEVRLGGRFTDDAVLVLMLAFAIQAKRIESKQFLDDNPEQRAWLKSLSIWPVAEAIAKRMASTVGATWPEAEVAAIAMHLLAAPRNDRWPGDLDIDGDFAELITGMLQTISERYQLPKLAHDSSLRDGIVTHVIPDCLGQRFDLRMPRQLAAMTLSNKYQFEHELAAVLSAEIEAKMACMLSAAETNNLAMLLRAAYIRERPAQVDRVFVVCPSGMATSQLLVARLKARFPRLGEPTVISVREMREVEGTESVLILTTVPVQSITSSIDERHFIQVHPLLLPEDIEHITEWLAQSQHT